jgi:hypothetical protein
MPVTDAEACRFVAGAGDWSRAYAFVRFGHHVEDFRKDQAMAAHSSARS